MYEYLAARVPVVATPLPVCVDHPVVRTAASADDFVDAVERAATERGSEEFVAAADEAADEASWDRRIDGVRERLAARRQLTVPSR